MCAKVAIEVACAALGAPCPRRRRRADHERRVPRCPPLSRYTTPSGAGIWIGSANFCWRTRRSPTRGARPTRGTYPLHVAAEFGQAAAARVLVEHGADVALLDSENQAIALCWAAFFGRPAVVAVLLEAGSAPSQRNVHGLTPLGCAVGGAQGRWQQFSDATLADWQRAADIIRAHGGVE